MLEFLGSEVYAFPDVNKGLHTRIIMLLQLFIINDDAPLAFAPHYRGIYLVEQKIGQASCPISLHLHL